ncbi:MAG: ABC transporter permease [Mesorhizobium amorphae]|nr:MAG: ABC transporter permease [Mesorhizobium amorphae]
MTDAAVPAQAQALPRANRAPTGIVPAARIGGSALMAVIAIMTFLSSLTLGAVTLVRDTASVWQSQIAREATVELLPVEGQDIEAALARTAETARALPGVTGARIVDRAATARLLEPWLGGNLDIDALPVPRLVIVTVDRDNPPDFASLRASLDRDGLGARLDDHRTWVDRLVAMAQTTVWAGLGILSLMLAATALAVCFATRGAMTGAGHVIEVLHFVGAEARFIAGEFRQHFLMIGLKGAAIGGVLAIAAFLMFSFWMGVNLATPGADQATALFGHFQIGVAGYAGVALIMTVVALIAAVTSHLTVVAFLADIDMARPDE